MDDDGVYMTVITLNIPYDYILSSDLDHSSATLEYPIVDGFEGSHEVTDVVGTLSEEMIFHIKKERI